MSRLSITAIPALIMACGLALAPAADAKNYLVENQAGFDKAVKKLKPGDRLVLKTGKWKNAQLKFKANGTADAPITLMAQDAGKVILTGVSNLRMGGGI